MMMNMEGLWINSKGLCVPDQEVVPEMSIAALGVTHIFHLLLEPFS